ncbi:MAG: aa3-type cytochrome oxidase subunit II [Actinomycetes bacterium]
MHRIGSEQESGHSPGLAVAPHGTRVPRARRVRGVRGVGRAGLLGLVVLVALPLLSACSVDDRPRLGLPDPATQQGGRILNLWQGSWLAALIVGVIVWGLILGSAFAFRRRHADDPLPKQTRYNLPIEAFYTIVPFMIITVLFFYTARDESKIESVSNSKNAVHIHVVGFQWSWQFQYSDAKVEVTGTQDKPPTLVLPVNRAVEFTLTSNDVNHSFWVPAFLYKLDVIPGRENRFEVTTTRTGTFAGKCAELCGTYHSRMLFNVKVVPQAEYDAYLSKLKSGSSS